MSPICSTLFGSPWMVAFWKEEWKKDKKEKDEKGKRHFGHSVQITEIYSHTSLRKISWKQSLLLKEVKFLESWFHEIFLFGESEFLSSSTLYLGNTYLEENWVPTRKRSSDGMVYFCNRVSVTWKYFVKSMHCTSWFHGILL